MAVTTTIRTTVNGKDEQIFKVLGLPAPKRQQQFERISRLPRAKQQVLMDMLVSVLAWMEH